MRMITAFVAAERLESICARLTREGIVGMTVTQCCGHGRDVVLVASINGGPDIPDLLPTTMIEVAVTGSQLNKAMRAILVASRSEGGGQGKILVRPLESVIDFRTGAESGDGSILDRTVKSRELPTNLSSDMR